MLHRSTNPFQPGNGPPDSESEHSPFAQILEHHKAALTVLPVGVGWTLRADQPLPDREDMEDEALEHGFKLLAFDTHPNSGGMQDVNATIHRFPHAAGA